MNTELKIGNKSYELRLTTKNCARLEDALGYNPLQFFIDIEEGNLPKVKDIATILGYMIVNSNNKETAYDILDDYVADGHNIFDIVPVFVEVMQNCGFINIPNDGDTNEKN